MNCNSYCVISTYCTVCTPNCSSCRFSQLTESNKKAVKES